MWIYYHLLDDPVLCKHAWGADSQAIPAWQRKLVDALYPLQAFMIRKVFRVNEAHYRKSCEHIEGLLADVEARLEDGRRSILGGEAINYTDITFAAHCGLWAQCEGYGGGMADDCRIERDEMPVGMRADVERWIEDHPKATTFVEELYAHER